MSNQHRYTQSPESAYMDRIMKEIENNVEGMESITNVPNNNVYDAPEMDDSE
ncbi:hypothetical protein FHS18_006778 [Paenibacillus phyllosphaerae]|uniref:Uncharacterized protein n=1 Tax=Paenibacillus phyllosphaerae TaxID=274593 RepID=A0A7W5FRK9_9BACL|nr:hypothetical protein [Paenibacillus phyllosphaerae]MBB3114640.1 hypothetical protein [Paenibacillus phyllosphaerae]